MTANRFQKFPAAAAAVVVVAVVIVEVVAVVVVVADVRFKVKKLTGLNFLTFFTSA